MPRDDRIFDQGDQLIVKEGLVEGCFVSQCSGVGWGRRETGLKFSEIKLNSNVFYLGSSVGTNSSATHSLGKNGNLDSLCLALS